MIVNAVRVNSQMSTGGTYTITLPGGTAAQPLARAFYGIEAFGWLSSDPSTRAISLPRGVALGTADASGVDLNMLPL